jgi:gamma-glutamyltranspeptidase/glutathione hydrolase
MSDADYLHHYLEASALSFADRGKYLGDPDFVDVPLETLLADDFAAERACLVEPDQALTKPVAPGDVDASSTACGEILSRADADTENISTTNLTVVDATGDVVEYTLTIEQTGGSGIVVPGRGFLLNNELTDFSLVWSATDPNRLEPGKRPRSSMAPTLVLRDGEPVLALGSPGGSTIITTVLQTLTNWLDRDMSIAEALSAPRATQRNTANVIAEPEFIQLYGEDLAAHGHTLVASGDQFTSAAEIGAATAVEIGPDGLLTAVSEPRRRGGGAALVLEPVSP